MKHLNDDEKNKYKKIRLVIQIIAVIIILGIAIYFLIKFIPFIYELNTNEEARIKFANEMKDIGPMAAFLLILMQIGQTIFMFIPSGPIVMVTGMIYNPFIGVLISLSGQVIGGIIVYILIKLFGLKFIALFVDPDKILNSNILKNKTRCGVIMFGYLLIPMLPKDIVAFVAPFTGIGLLPFTIISLVARIPMTIVTVLMGGSLVNGNYLTLGILAGVSIILAILCFVFNKKIEVFINNLGKKGDKYEE